MQYIYEVPAIVNNHSDLFTAYGVQIYPDDRVEARDDAMVVIQKANLFVPG